MSFLNTNFWFVSAVLGMILIGYSEDWVRLLKRAILKEPEFFDLKVPEGLNT